VSTTLRNKYYNGHHRATEEGGGQRTLVREKEIWITGFEFADRFYLCFSVLLLLLFLCFLLRVRFLRVLNKERESSDTNIWIKMLVFEERR